jgi:CRP/FNR family transcriptional regulator, cyclic AMP receptor protein
MRTMATPYNLDVYHDCSKCPVRSERGFCDLNDEAVAELTSITNTIVQPKGALLFVEGEEARGVYILCSGRVKQTMLSAAGRTLIVNVVEPGQVLGVSAAMLGKPYELTAETLMPSQVDFIRRDDFLRFVQKYPLAAMKLTMQLSDNCAAAHNDIRALGLAQNTGDKLARLLVNWSERTGTRVANGIRMTVLLKHEEIAQMIGATRETVTRTLSDFRRQKLLEVKGSTFIVADDLQRLATI